MSDGPVEELQEFRVRLANGELEIVRGTRIEQQTSFDGPSKVIVLAGRELVGEFFAPLAWFKAPRNKLLGFEDGLNDALSSSWLSQNGPHVLDAYKRGWDVGAELHIFRAEKDRLAEAVALTPAPEAEPGSDALEIPEGFTRHDGGSTCPVDGEVRVTILLRNGHISENRVAAELRWYAHENKDIGRSDILAYRIISEPAGEGETNAVAPPVGYTKIAAEGVRCRCINLWTDGVGGYYCCNANTSADASKEIDQRVTSAGYQHVVDAEPAPVLRADVPADATTFTAPSGELFATFNGQTHLVLNDPPAEQSEPYSAAHEAEEQPQDLPPLLPPEAPKAITPEDMEARGLVDSEASWWARKMAKELV